MPKIFCRSRAQTQQRGDLSARAIKDVKKSCISLRAAVEAIQRRTRTGRFPPIPDISKPAVQITWMAHDSDDVRHPELRWLIDHEGWQALPRAPGEDLQGLDVRERIGKEGVVFSAYRVPRGLGDQVHLEPPPQWAKSAGLACSIDIQELGGKLSRNTADSDGGFRALNSRLEEIKATFKACRLRVLRCTAKSPCHVMDMQPREASCASGGERSDS